MQEERKNPSDSSPLEIFSDVSNPGFDTSLNIEPGFNPGDEIEEVSNDVIT